MIVAGQASGVGTSAAIPAHQAGDMILVFTRGTAALPSIPAAGGTVPTWTSPQGAIANGIALCSAYAIATASNHTTGTWTNAAHICVLVLRPDSGKVLTLGATSSGNANNTQTIVYPALTCQVVDGSSLAVRVGTRTVADSEIANVPGTYVLQTVQPAGASALMAVFTRAVIANQTAGTVTTAGTNAPYRAHTIEVKEQLAAQIKAVSGVTSPQTFGTLTTSRFFGAGGVAPAAAFGTFQFKFAFGVAGLSSAQAFGALPFGPVTAVPGVPPSTYDTHIVGEYLAGQALVGWTGGNQFGTPLAKNLDFVGVGGVLSAQSFGAVTIRAAISRAPLGVPSAQSFGKVSLRFVLAGIPSAQAFGTPFFIAVQGLVVPPGVLSAQAFGTLRFRLTALVGGVASAQAFGTVRPLHHVQASGVASAQAFGAPSFKLRFGGTGVGSAQAFGTPTFAFRKAVLGVSSAQSFGIPKALFLVRPVGLGSAQAFGQIVVRSGPVWVVVTGLGSAQAFGTTLDVYNVWVFPVSCLGVDLVGVPDYGEVLTAVADTSVALTNGVEQAVDLDAVTCVPVALDPVEIA